MGCRALLADGSRSDVEMQMQMQMLRDLAARVVYYAARDFADQLRRGDGYHQLTPTAGVVWLVEPLFPSEKRFHSVFELRERQTNTRFSDHLSIHLLQLSHLSPSDAIGYAARVERWGRFFLARTDREFERLALEDPVMRIAKETLEKLSLDPEVRRRAREREDSLKLYQMSLVASRAEGKAEGMAAALLMQLRLRFGAVPDGTRARVETATLGQLDGWVEQILTARTLDDVFTR